MDGSNTTLQERGQISIGSLIIFVAIVLVASTAAGVLLATAGFLESQAEATVEDSVDGVTERVEVMSAAGTAGADDQITTVTVTLMPSPGAQAIDLSEATVEVFVAGDVATLRYADGDDPEAGTEFTAERLRNGNSTTLAEREERGQLTIALNEEVGPLQAGEAMTIVITTAAGTETQLEITAPTTVDEGDTVRL